MDQTNLSAAFDLIYLVSCSVNGQQPDPERCSNMDYEAVFQIARDHSLTAAAVTALEQVAKLPGNLYEEKYKEIRRQALFAAERKKVFDMMEEKGIWYAPLKGMVLNEYYPRQIMRQMADYDILFDKTKAEELKPAMEELGFVCVKNKKGHHDVYCKSPFIVFEMHRALLPRDYIPYADEYFGALDSRLVRDECRPFSRHLTDEDFYLHLICHMYKHYHRSGIGLRSLLDIYVFNQKKGSEPDRQRIGDILRRFQLDAFEAYMRTLSEKVFTCQPLNQEELQELAFFIESKCYGNTDNAVGDKLNHDDSGKSKRRYLLRRIFPDDTYLKNAYPAVHRHKVLYPFLVVYRPFKGIFTERKKLAAEYKAVKAFQKNDVNTKGKFRH